MPLARSRYRGGIGSIGQGTFSQTATPSCPPGQHWEGPAASAVRGISACVPNTVIPLTLRPPPPPPPSPPITRHIIPLTLPGLQPSAPPPQIVTAPAPSGGDAAAAPAPVPATCPPPWPWWWILVAGVVAFGGGYYAEQNKKKVKRNAGRYAGRIVNRAGDVVLARLLG